MKPQLSLIVFAYNEAENVPPVLRELRDHLERHHPATQIVFVDDNMLAQASFHWDPSDVYATYYQLDGTQKELRHSGFPDWVTISSGCESEVGQNHYVFRISKDCDSLQRPTTAGSVGATCSV